MTDRKPDVQEVLELLEMKTKAATLYEEIDERLAVIQNEFGAGRFDYDLGSVDEDGKQYLKFETVDNVHKLIKGEPVWKSVAFKPVSFSIGMLKNCPKSLK